MADRNDRIIVQLHKALMHLEDFFDDLSTRHLSHKAFDHICDAEYIVDELIMELENEQQSND